MSDLKPTARNPWAWIPTLYLAQGLPFAVVNFVSIIMCKSLGVSNADIAFYTAWLYLPWVIKPLWSPVVDILKTRRQWIWVMQLLIGAGLAGVALTIPATNFFQYTLAFLWLLAFSSATHDIAADGYYMLALTEQEQAFFVGIRSTFYRIAMISGNVSSDASVVLLFDRHDDDKPVVVRPTDALRLTVASCKSGAHG